MRKITLLLATVFMAITGYAQENRALFSGDGLSDSAALFLMLFPDFSGIKLTAKLSNV